MALVVHMVRHSLLLHVAWALQDAERCSTFLCSQDLCSSSLVRLHMVDQLLLASEAPVAAGILAAQALTVLTTTGVARRLPRFGSYQQGGLLQDGALAADSVLR